MKVEHWPQGQLLQRRDAQMEIFLVFDHITYGPDKEWGERMRPIAEEDWPDDYDLTLCGNGEYIGIKVENIEDSDSDDDDVVEEGGGGKKKKKEEEEEEVWYSEDLSDSCEICGKIPEKEDQLVHCHTGGHSYHKECINFWRDRIVPGNAEDRERVQKYTCPHCKFPKNDVEKCPVIGCKKEGTIKHLIKRHIPKECTMCHRKYLKQARKCHDSMDCGEWIAQCPAPRCKVEVTTLLAHMGTKNPRLLAEDHDCKELHPCAYCEEIFYYEDALLSHARNKRCKMTNGVRSSLLPNKRKSAEEAQKVIEKVSILEEYAT